MKHFTIPLLLAASFVFLLHLSPSEAGDWPEDCGNNKTHNFRFGAKSYYDRLMYNLHEKKSSSFLRKLSYDYNIPPKGTYPVSGVITSIEVLDQYTDGNGGCVYWKSGGPGYKNATLHIKSQRNHGVDFIINVYGR